MSSFIHTLTYTTTTTIAYYPYTYSHSLSAYFTWSLQAALQGNNTPRRPIAMLLDALVQEDEESEIDYAKLKEKAHDRETWRH